MKISQQLVQNLKNLQEIRHSDCQWEWETRDNAETSQCITKFMTDER